MRFLMFVCVDPTPDHIPTAATTATALAAPPMDINDWVEDVDRRGVRVTGNELTPADQTVAVRVRDGETLRTDGPFPEAHELIAGFDILECADLDEAIEIARRHPMARDGAIELRPFRALADV
ncbi:MAG TPA: YciI family protein [Thermomicrobiales bacterium]|jgi:hypothetical protein|nr:YciI family protein [Thermomicrobiales bacterium]